MNPDDKAVANRTDETEAPTPAPAAAPHTMNTYKNDAKHSAMIDLKEKKENIFYSKNKHSIQKTNNNKCK